MASCHTHAATKLSFHRSLRSLTICAHLCYLWEALLHQKLLCVPWIPWENPTQPNHLCASVKSVGGFQRAAWVWQGCHILLSVFCGRTRTLNFCGFRAFRGRTRAPWGKNTKRAWRNAMPSYVSYVDAWVWQGCHTLL